MGYTIEASENGCYPGTTVLVNKFDLHSQEELHPFREGNGRTQRVFLSQLAQNAGYPLDFSCVDPDELMIATIYAAQGIDEPLKTVFEKIVGE